MLKKLFFALLLAMTIATSVGPTTVAHAQPPAPPSGPSLIGEVLVDRTQPSAPEILVWIGKLLDAMGGEGEIQFECRRSSSLGGFFFNVSVMVADKLVDTLTQLGLEPGLHDEGKTWMGKTFVWNCPGNDALTELLTAKGYEKKGDWYGKPAVPASELAPAQAVSLEKSLEPLLGLFGLVCLLIVLLFVGWIVFRLLFGRRRKFA